MTAERYYVKRPTGKVFGPFDKNAIQMMLKSNKLGWDAQVSRDKVDWIELASLPEFGGGDLPRPVGPPDLPRPVGGSDLPRPVGGSNLPRPVGGSDLPRPVGGSDLPRPVGGSDLPRPVGGSNLPRPAGSNLPQPASSLPQPASSLPQPAGHANLPRSQGAPPIPSPVQGNRADDLFGGPVSDAQEDDLFGAPPSRGREDDLFGGPMSDAQEDDLFGSPANNGGGNNDLFGGPSEGDDLFGVQGNQPPPARHEPMGGDDLFGGPVGGGISEGDLFGGGQEDDLFGQDAGGDDDFLGGDQGFSFLDEAPSALDADNFSSNKAAGSSDSWGDDLLSGNAPPKTQGNDSWEDDLLSGNAPPSSGFSGNAPPSPGSMSVDLDAVHTPSVGAAPDPDGGDPFRPASTGIPMASTGIPAQQTETQAKDEDKGRGNMMLIGVPIIAIVVIGALGYGIFSAMSNDNSSNKKSKTKTVKFDINLDKLKSSSHAEMRDLLTRSKKAKKSKALEEKIMLTEGLYLLFYQDKDIAKSAAKRAKGFKSSKGLGAIGAAGYHANQGSFDEARKVLEPLSGQDGLTGFYASVFLGATNVLDIEKQGAPLAKAPEKEEPTKEDPAKAPEDGKKEDGKKTTPAKDGEETKKDGEPGSEEPKVKAPPKVEDSPLIKETRKLLAKVKKTDGTLPEYWTGRLHEAIKKNKKARRHYTASLKAADDFIPTHVALGRLLYGNGNLNEASKHLERVNKELSAKASNSERAEALHFMGKVHSARSQSDMAIANFTKALQIDTSRTDTLRALAEEYERAQKYKEALNFFKTNKTLGQKDPEVMLGIVRAHMGLKEWKQAIAQLEVGEKGFPSDARFPFYLGQLNMKRGTFYDAQKALERAVEIDPKLLQAHATLAQLAWRNEKDAVRGEKHIAKIVEHSDLIDALVAKEVAEFYRMAENRDLATKWFQSSIDKDPNYWPSRLALSRLLLEQGETSKALKLLERSRSEGVTDIRLSAYLADAYRQSKMYDRAINEINKVIEKFPKDPDYTFIRGRIYFDRGNYDTALGDFNRAYELNPRFHEAYFYVGRTAFERNDFNKARQIFRHVLDYQPNNGEFRFFMGRVLEKENRLTQALEEYRKVTEVDPGYGIRNPRAYIFRGRLLSRLGYSTEGKKDIARALDLAPEMDDALIAMGEADFRDKEYDKAIGHFTKALAKNPKHADAQHKLGMAYVFRERNRDGARHLQLAIKYGYKKADVYQTLGYLYKGLGQTALARQAFKTFLEKTNNGVDLPKNTLKEILRQLKELGG